MKHNTKNLPQIPNKRYFTIGEVSYLCAVKPHVLRYWEQEFPQLKPAKRRGNRRYYQREDVIMVRTIRGLLYDEGYTISGARIQLENVVKQQRKANRIPVESAAVKTEQHLSQSVNTRSIDSEPAEKQAQNISYSVKYTVGKDIPHVTAVSNQAKKVENNLGQQLPKSQPQQSVEEKRLHKYKFILGEVITEPHDMLIELQDSKFERV